MCHKLKSKRLESMDCGLRNCGVSPQELPHELIYRTFQRHRVSNRLRSVRPWKAVRQGVSA